MLGELSFLRERCQKESFAQREPGGVEEQYRGEEPASTEAWAASNRGQALLGLLEIRGARLKTA